MEREDIYNSVQAMLKKRFADIAFLSEGLRGCQTVQDFISKHRSRFRGFGSSTPVRDEVGFYHEAQGQFLFNPQGFREACGNHDPSNIASELHKLNLLEKREKDRYLSKVTAEGVRQSFYVVNQSILEEDFNQKTKVQSESNGTDGTDGTPPYKL